MKKAFAILLTIVLLTSCTGGGKDTNNTGISINTSDNGTDLSLNVGGLSLNVSDDESATGVSIGMDGNNILNISDSSSGSSVEMDTDFEGIDIENNIVVSDTENTIITNGLSDEVKVNTTAQKEVAEAPASCSKEYDSLLEKHGKSFADCNFQKPKVNSCDLNESEIPKINVVIIFDDSGSMGNKVGRDTMLEIAKEKVDDYIDDLSEDKNTNIGFILYGHKGNSTSAGKAASCSGVEVIKSLNSTSTVTLQNKISSLEPNGWTAIGSSLKKAKTMIESKAKPIDKNIVLLISDGKETCGGNPSAEAKKIAEINDNTYVDVIGFNVDSSTESQLSKIAKSGNGSYYNVKNKADFENVFNQTKTFLSAMSCGASKAAIELSYGVKAIETYHTCMADLKEEEIKVMVDANSSCKDYTEGRLEERAKHYESKFEVILEAGEEILDNFDEHIDKAEEMFEDYEDDGPTGGSFDIPDTDDYDNFGSDMDNMFDEF